MRDATSRSPVSAHGRGQSPAAGSGIAENVPAFPCRGSSAPARGLALRAKLAILGAVAAAFLGLAAAPASAELVYAITGEYGKEGPKASGINSSCLIGFDSANQRIYLVAGGTIYGLQRTGPGAVAPLGGAFPVASGSSAGGCGDHHFAVDNSATATAGNMAIVTSSSQIRPFSSAGAAFPVISTGSGETCGVGIDANGIIWGGNYTQGKALKFKYDGTAQGDVPFGVGSQVCKITMDPGNSDFYIAPYSSGASVTKRSASSGYTDALLFPGATGTTNNPRMVVNPTQGRLFVGSGSGPVKSYNTSTGALVEEINYGGNSSAGVAVDKNSGALFVADTQNNVIKELMQIQVPKATTQDPTGNTQVAGLAQPDGAGNITECYFEWGLASNPAGQFPEKTNCEEPLPYAADTTVHATLPGLLGETTYRYRLVVATATVGSTRKGVEKQITPHNVKSLKTEPATEVTRTTAKLNATFEGNGEPTTYYFEYEPTSDSNPGYAKRIPEAPAEDSAGSPPSPEIATISKVVTDLKPETSYRFRVVAKNGLGVSPGQERQFTTPLAVEGVTTGKATDIQKTTATLNGSFTGNGEPHTFVFEWGEDTSYGNKVEGTAPAGTGTINVSAPISGTNTFLPGDPPYHFRLIVTNATGSTTGQDKTFVSAPPDKPLLSGITASDVTRTTAKVSGTINPGGGETIYLFEYGTDTTYGSASPLSGPLPGDETTHPVSAQLEELEPGTTYHYRLVAINFAGTSHGPDQTFTTTADPQPVVPPAVVPPATNPTPQPEGKKPPTKCEKGFVKRNGKCVKKKKKKRRKAGKRRHG